MYNRKIIIDPYLNGCTLWQGNYVGSIRGTLKECCNNIYSRVVVTMDKNNKLYNKQVIGMAVDIAEIGIAYKDYLEHLGLEVSKIKPKSIDSFIPAIIV